MADVIGQNPLFISAIRLIMAQRLVRRLDDTNKQPYQPDETTLARLRAVIDTLPEGTDRPNLEGLQLYKPGSSTDNPYGYKGQIAIREQFLMSGEIRHLMQQTTIVPSTEEIEAAAIKSGMRTMRQDGFLKAIAGQTTIEEIYRVLG